MPAPPELSADALLAVIDSRLADVIGAQGEWTLVRRVDGDTDQIFHAAISAQIAADLAERVIAAKGALRTAPGTEPHALSWTPAPVAVWADAAPTSAAPTPVAAAHAARDAIAPAGRLA